MKACFRSLHPGVNPYAICYVRVITRVLDNRAGHKRLCHDAIDHFQIERNAFRRRQHHEISFFTAQQHLRGCFGCGSRAGSGGIAETHFLIIFDDIIGFNSGLMFHSKSVFLLSPLLP